MNRFSYNLFLQLYLWSVIISGWVKLSLAQRQLFSSYCSSSNQEVEAVLVDIIWAKDAFVRNRRNQEGGEGLKMFDKIQGKGKQDSVNHWR